MLFSRVIRKASILCEKYYFKSCSTVCKSKMSKQEESVALGKVVQALEEFASPSLAASWDNVGLLVEPPGDHAVSRLLLTNDLTEAVLQEAISKNVNMIISYHPPIFGTLKCINNSTWKGRILSSCLSKRIAVYSPHTAWDSCENGVTDWLAQAFRYQFQSLEPIEPTHKISTFMADIVGKAADVDKIIEQKMTVLTKSKLAEGKVLYKVVADGKSLDFLVQSAEVIVSRNEVQQKDEAGGSGSGASCKTGMGRIFTATSPITLKECIDIIQSYLGLINVRLAMAPNQSKEFLIKKVALVPGSGGSLLRGVQADLFVTGEMFHHDILEANHNGTSVILTNHSVSERGFLSTFKEYFSSWFPNITVVVSTADKDPITDV